MAAVGGDRWTRFLATVRLERRDDPESEQLLWQSLDDPSEDVRAAAASALIRRDASLDAAALLRRLRRSEDGSAPTAAEIVAYALSSLRSVDVITPLVEALSACEGVFRPDLLRALAMTQQPAALAPLRTALESDDMRSRRYAALIFGVLWPLGDEALRPLLAVARESNDSEQRGNALSSLGAWFDSSEIATDTVLDAALNDPSRMVRAQARQTLAERRASVRPQIELAFQTGDLRRRLRAKRILRHADHLQRSMYLPQNYAAASAWKKRLFMLWILLRALPLLVAVLAERVRSRIRKPTRH